VGSVFYNPKLAAVYKNGLPEGGIMPETKPEHRGYNSLQPYLIVKNCAAALEFYKKALGATERMRMTRPDGTIGHAEIQIGDTCVMMADENPQIEAFSPEHYGGSPISLHFYVENCDAAFQRAMAAGGKQKREPTDQPYGDRNAGIIDPFGYTWWMSTPIAAAAQQSSSAKK
jgi:PhnB protein